jgi:hypothetical protein
MMLPLAYGSSRHRRSRATLWTSSSLAPVPVCFSSPQRTLGACNRARIVYLRMTPNQTPTKVEYPTWDDPIPRTKQHLKVPKT